jgi:dethiobiotin synthetase
VADPTGIFVTGTGTDVGKTVAAAVIAQTLAREGHRVAVFKPAVTGLDDPGDGDHELLRRAAGSSQSDDEIAPNRYGPPASPHLAAALAGEEIDPARLRAAASAAAASADFLVCEGVGGLLVPLVCQVSSGIETRSESFYLVRDLAAELGYPLVVVAPPGLGTINHTLLTIEAARAVGLAVAGVVLTPWPEQPSEIELSNRETIAILSAVEVQTLPLLDLTTPATWPELRLMGRSTSI